MSEALTALLRRLDHMDLAAVSFDETPCWPEGELAQLVTAGLLLPAEPAQQLVCDECGELEDVVLVESVVSPPCVAFLSCSLSGAYQIPLERLQRWQISATRLVDVVQRFTGVVGGRDEVIRQRLWRLGKIRWCGTAWNAYFGRGLHRHDAWRVLNESLLPPRSIVFFPSKRPRGDVRINRMPVLISLSEVLSFQGGKLHFDREAVEQQLAGELPACPPPPTARRKGSRPGVIAALRRELKEHVRAARDYAEETLETTGTARLLRRPTMKELARRVGVDKSTVSRCFEDPSADDLRYMWELAADVDRLLSAAGCRV